MRRRERVIAWVTGAALSFAKLAQASEYGCTVLLCLANPNGPEAVAECIDPIRQLRRDLARGRDFPSCEEANDNGGTRVQFSNTRYEPCPTGMVALGEGEYAALGGNTVSSVYRGIGDGANAQSSGNEVQTYPPKTCVGAANGSVTADIGAGDNPQLVRASVYDQVVQLPASDGSSLDVYVQHQLYRRVRLK